MPPQMQSGAQQNYFIMGNNPLMNQIPSLQMNQMGQIGQMGQMGQMGPLNQMNPMSSLNQMNFPMNSFQNNPNFVNPYQQNLNKNIGIRPNTQSFPNNNMNPQMFMNPYQTPCNFPQNMIPNNPMFMNNKPGFLFPGGGNNQMNSPKMGVYEMCQDQNGSRQIQQQFEHGTDQEKENIYNSIEENILILMKDVFGNYVVQKMFEKGFFNLFLIFYI